VSSTQTRHDCNQLLSTEFISSKTVCHDLYRTKLAPKQTVQVLSQRPSGFQPIILPVLNPIPRLRCIVEGLLQPPSKDRHLVAEVKEVLQTICKCRWARHVSNSYVSCICWQNVCFTFWL